LVRTVILQFLLASLLKVVVQVQDKDLAHPEYQEDLGEEEATVSPADVAVWIISVTLHLLKDMLEEQLPIVDLTMELRAVAVQAPSEQMGQDHKEV
jgi:hypothetical protein